LPCLARPRRAGAGDTAGFLGLAFRAFFADIERDPFLRHSRALGAGAPECGGERCGSTPDLTIRWTETKNSGAEHDGHTASSPPRTAGARRRVEPQALRRRTCFITTTTVRPRLGS
jgi:hypothetical protein